MQKMQAGILLQNKNTKNLLFPYEETKRMKPYKCLDCPKLCSPQIILNYIQIYFLQEESIMKRNGTNARNAFRHFLSKEEHKESEIQGNITMLAM